MLGAIGCTALIGAGAGLPDVGLLGTATGFGGSTLVGAGAAIGATTTCDLSASGAFSSSTPIGTANSEGTSSATSGAAGISGNTSAGAATSFGTSNGLVTGVSSFFQNFSFSVQLFSGTFAVVARAAGLGTSIGAVASTGLSSGFLSLFQNCNLSKSPLSFSSFSFNISAVVVAPSTSPVAAPAVPCGTTSPRTRASVSFSKSKITRRCSITLPPWRIW